MAKQTVTIEYEPDLIVCGYCAGTSAPRLPALFTLHPDGPGRWTWRPTSWRDPPGWARLSWTDERGQQERPLCPQCVGNVRR